MIAKLTNAEYLRSLRAVAVKQGKCPTCRLRLPSPGMKQCDKCSRRGWAKRRDHSSGFLVCCQAFVMHRHDCAVAT